MTELNELMEFGRVVQVDENGVAHAVESGYEPDAPEEIQYVDLDENGGAPDPVAPNGWEYLTGFTGQYGYNGPVMHTSEFIGGRLAEHILAHPGYYIVVSIDALNYEQVDPETQNPDEPDEPDAESVGWGVLRFVGATA